MAKTLNELSREMRDFIVDLQSDAHNAGGINKYRYNNLKIEILDPRTAKIPQVKITIGMSEAIFNLANAEKASGGLGPDERYVLRWFAKEGNVAELKNIWKNEVKHTGKATGPE